jgi:ureidoacrylate peracid hydrolase
VIDPVNDFLSEGGADWDMARSTVEKHDVVGHLKQAIEGTRQRGIPVLFAPMAYTAEDYQNEELQRRSGINRMMFRPPVMSARASPLRRCVSSTRSGSSMPTPMSSSNQNKP